MFVFFTIYGILHLVFSNSSLINYEKYEKELILSSSSIARYSSYLWLVQKPKTPNDTTESRGRGFWIILADVGGGILGAGGGYAGVAACASAGSLIAEQLTGKGK